MTHHRNHRDRRSQTTRSFFEPLEGRQLMSGGELDPTFGTGGITPAPAGESMWARWATDVAVQPDGKTVVVGTSLFKDKNGYTTFHVERFNTDGKIERTFNGQGFNGTNFGHATRRSPAGSRATS